MIKKSNNKCLNCGGNLIFSPQFEALYCNNCKSITKIIANKNNKKYNYVNNEVSEENNKSTSTNCTNCGAFIQLDKREITKTCPYCDTNFVVDEKDIQGIKPTSVIPFSFDKEKAVEYYKNGIKKKHFLPNKFKASPSIDSIYGTYISCFSFDTDTFSKYSGKISYTTTYSKDGKTYSQTNSRLINGEKNMQFKDFLIESSELTNQDLFDEVKPYIIDNSTTYEYNPDFIRGYDVKTYDTSLSSCKVLSEEYIKEKIKSAILSGYSYDRVDYFNLNTNFTNYKFSYILLPLYFVDYEYKNKKYTTYINGQTGKIGNNLPKSKVKIFFSVFTVILIILLIIGLSLFLN